jgi:hypothetical protein
MLEQIQTIKEEMWSWLDEVWTVFVPENHTYYLSLAHSAFEVWFDDQHPQHARLIESVQRLRQRWPVAELSQWAAEMYCQPILWRPHPATITPAERDNVTRYNLILTIVEAVLYMAPPAGLFTRLEQRILNILDKPDGSDYPDWPPAPRLVGFRRSPYSHYHPGLRRCLHLLVKTADSPAAIPILEKAVRRKIPQEIDVSLHLEALWRLDYLSYEQFASFVWQNAHILVSLNGLFNSHKLPPMGSRGHRQHVYVSPEFLTLMRTYVNRFTDEIAADVTEKNYRFLKPIQNLSGARWLLLAAELHQKFQLKTLVDGHTADSYRFRAGIDTAVIHLAHAQNMEPDDPAERAALVNQLQSYPAQTLKYLLPVSPHGRHLLLDALGWQAADHLLTVIFDVAAQSRRYSGYRYQSGDVQNSAAAAIGVLDVPLTRQAIAAIGQPLALELLKLHREAKVGVDNTLMLIETFMGRNLDKLEKQLKKRQQLAVKAYGLQPLTRGSNELLERYLWLQQFAKESKKFGPERQANERAAVEAALANLAQVAGYADPLRLEWDMEAKLATELLPAGQTWPLGDFTVTLTLNGSEPAVEVSRNGKPLKSIPPAVRQHPTYPTIRQGINQLREQARRFKTVFEEMMALGTPLTRQDLTNLCRMPIAAYLLSRLILQTESGALGIFHPQTLTAHTLNGRPLDLGETALIAHPYHLYQRGELAEWQRHIVHHRLVQPVKQAFRELYLLTPAEEETHTYSNRFAGHAIDGSTATRLFQSRGWQIKESIDVLPNKLFPEQGLQAIFELSHTSHFLALAEPTSERIAFRAYPQQVGRYPRTPDTFLPLSSIPPLLFSEVMRDADLIISVAHQAEYKPISAETFLRRGELIQTLLDDLELPGVRIDGHFAHVTGQLANYRVHLGSATIHIEPGNYLCIVPDKWGQQHEKLFLPFAGEGDPKLSEVISKILLLLQDNRIKDPAILHQIQRKTIPS